MAWDKDQPAGTLKVREADDYIRANNDALEDALSRQHTFPGTYGSTAGKHTVGEVGVLLVDTKTNLGTGTGVEGAMSYASDTETLYRDTGTNISAITSIPTGTKAYFYQNTAPAGWTLDAAVVDRMLAVKGGSAAYNTNGGTSAGDFSHIHTTGNHTLSIAEMPNHNHNIYGTGGGGGAGSSTPSTATPYPTSYTGGDEAHNHGNTGSLATYRPYAAVGIICTKD